MRPTRLISSILAGILGVALMSPNPTLALREQATREKDSETLAGLEEALQSAKPLGEIVTLNDVRVIYPGGVEQDLSTAGTVLVTADAGKGTRWRESGGIGPKHLALVGGLPVGWWTKRAAKQLGWPVISIVGPPGSETQEVITTYNRFSRQGVIYVGSENQAGGTGYAFYHAAAVKGLRESDALVVATLGDHPLFDRPILEAVARAARTGGADLVIASAIFDDPKGKGRIVRERGTDRILGILEQRDIEGGMTLGGYTTDQLLAIREGNVSIYAMPAHPFFQSLAQTTNANAQRQFYVTDLVKMIIDRGGRIEAVRIPAEKAPDITTVDDLAKAEAVLARQAGLEEVFHTELADRMRHHDELPLEDLTAWAATLGKSREDLLTMMRELGPTLMEADGRTWRSFFEVVTEDGGPTGQMKAFSAMHRDGDWHQGVAVLIRAPDGRLLLQWRNNEKRDLSASGHVELGFSHEEAALAEVFEELTLRLDPARLQEVRNPRQDSQGLFRKIGRQDDAEPGRYDGNGIYHSRSQEPYNREIIKLFTYTLTNVEMAALERGYRPGETRGYNLLTIDELLENYQTTPQAYSSGVAQFFAGGDVLIYLQQILLLDQLEQERWLPHWIATFRRFSGMAKMHPALFDEFSIFLDQASSGLGQTRMNLIVPTAGALSPRQQELVRRYLVAMVNNTAWLFLKQPADTASSQGAIRLAGPWAPAVKASIDEASLIQALSSRMLYGPVSLEIVGSLPPSVMVATRTIAYARVDEFDPRVDQPVVGVDIGGTNLKFVILRHGRLMHHELISNWRQREADLARLGFASFLANAIYQLVASSGLDPMPRVIGISWPGPVREPHILGSVSVEGILEGLLKAVEEGRLPGDPARLQQELNMLRDGRFGDWVREKITERFGTGLTVRVVRDAFAEAFGVAVVTHNEAYTGTSTNTRSGGTVTLTAGTGGGGYVVESDGRVPISGDPLLYELGRVVVSMDPQVPPHRSTGIAGTVGRLFQRETLEYSKIEVESLEEAGEATAALALVMREMAGTNRATLTGGNAADLLASAARRALRNLAPTEDPDVDITLSPVIEMFGVPHPIYTPAIGAGLAALAEYQQAAPQFATGLEKPQMVARRMVRTRKAQAQLAARGFLVETTSEGEIRGLIPVGRAFGLPANLYAHATLFSSSTIRGHAYRLLGSTPDVVRRQISDHLEPPDAIFLDQAVMDRSGAPPEAWLAIAPGVLTVVADSGALGRPLEPEVIGWLSALTRPVSETAPAAISLETPVVVHTLSMVTVGERQYYYVAGRQA